MDTGSRNNRFFLGAFLWLLASIPLQAGTLVFSSPQKRAVLPWSTASGPGVSPQGAEWLMADKKGKWILELEGIFDFFSPVGRPLQTFHPLDKSNNFYGFCSMECLPDGGLALLARLESPLEQRNKDNFEERSKPGSRLILLSPEGKVMIDKEELDRQQPHSAYFLQDGVVVSVHEDGSYEVLDRIGGSADPDEHFSDFAHLAFNPERWRSHLEKLPVYRAEKKSYHDIQNHLHQYQGALATLLGRRFIEGIGPLGERKGRIYYQVICDKAGRFSNAVFVEDPRRNNYALVDLVPPEEGLNQAHPFALFVDPLGNLFEGVSKKDGYRIYEWKSPR